MSRQLHHIWAAATCLVMLVTGCAPSQPFYFFEDGDLSHYKGVATEIEFPDVEVCSLAEVDGALPPLTLINSEAREIWDLTLQDAVNYALQNSRVMRSLGGQVQPVPNSVLRSPQVTPTVYDPAIVESNPLTGVEGALSAFDTQLTSSVSWDRNERPVNLNTSNQIFDQIFVPVFEQDLGTFQAQLQKTAATGGTFAVRHNTVYDWNNNPTRAAPSDWNVNMEALFSQPLLQGGGVTFNRIAGPNAQPGFFFGNGVVIGRIREDIALADFEIGVRTLVADVETAYWELYFAYRNLDSVVAGRDSALQTWRKIKALFDTGSKGGEAEKEAQAREQYFLFRTQVEQALNNLYSTENRLRYIIGLAATDGRLIRPADEPTTAGVHFDWYETHAESLARQVELRRQKWTIKQREMELIASRNFLLPRLDAIGRYRWVGLGDKLIDSNGSQFNNFVDTNAWEILTDGDFQEWQLGLQFSMPLGFRQELAGVRNAQLNLARERAILQDQELELSHQLADAIRNLDRGYTLSETNFNRRIAAQHQVNAVEAAYETDTVTLDVLLDAQRRLADAESAYYRSLVDFNLAIMSVHLRKGSLLEYNGVLLAEGPWPGKAYFDARKRARERDAALYLNYGFTHPRVLSRGPLSQNLGGSVGIPGQDNYPTPAGVEEVPVPESEQKFGTPSPETTPPVAPEARLRPMPQTGAAVAPGAGTTKPFDWGSLGIGSGQPTGAVAATAGGTAVVPASATSGAPSGNMVQAAGGPVAQQPGGVTTANYQQWQPVAGGQPRAGAAPYETRPVTTSAGSPYPSTGWAPANH